VILDTGGSAPGYSNIPFQKLISKLTRTCWFDRAGLGWSDPSPVTQTSASIAVLLDSVQEDQQQYEPRSTLSPINRLPAVVRGVLCRATPFAAKVGLIRVVMSASGPDRRVPSGFTPSEAAVLHGLESQPKAIVASSGCDAWEKSAAEAREAGTLGDVLLTVLTAGKPLTVGDPQVDQEIQAFHETWVHHLQPRLAALSTRGKQVIVEESSHGIAGDMPSAALEAVRQILSETRGR
jgi:hypothetical protein